MKQIIFLCIVLLGLAACASTHKAFAPTDLKPGQGVALGKVFVKYNGKNFNPECTVCLHTVDGPCQKLTPEGFVFLGVKQGETSVRRVFCQDTSGHHYNIEGATFTQGEHTYFGEVHLDWNNKGGRKATDFFGLVGAAVSESKNDGALKMTVKAGDMAGVVKAYEAQTNQKDLRVAKSLVKVGK